MTSLPTERPAASPRVARLYQVEDAVVTTLLVVMALLPLVEVVARLLSVNVPGAIQYLSALTMIVGFLGAAVAARSERHLSLATGNFLPTRWAQVASVATIIVAAVVSGGLAVSAWITVAAERQSGELLPPGVPVWIFAAVMPLGYGVVALRLIFARYEKWSHRAILIGLVSALLFCAQWLQSEQIAAVLWPMLALLLVATALGAPIFVVLGGAALLLFWADDEPLAAVATETMRQISNPIMPTIPLFTFTGYVLAESKASERLVQAFRAVLGWLPGGSAVMAVVVCAFFTTFTGASGVTILALGPLLFPVLIKARYPENFSVGLLTASGSIGLLFYPAVPVILYGVVAHQPIDRMFVAGLLPGVVLVSAVSAYGIYTGIRSGEARTRFEIKSALSALNTAKWELAIPILVGLGFFLGLTTPPEAAAFSAAYVLFVEVVIHKDLSLRRDLLRVGRECAVLVGGVLIILGVAMGFTSYVVDAEIPAQLLDWAKVHVESKWVFLLALNIFLLIVGCLMDIFSALVVVVPLILPLGRHYGVHPIHLGIIFLANLELGFLTPPVGMNLFLASYRFKQPLSRVYRQAVPFLLVLLAAVLVLTYVPELTLAPVRWIFGALPEADPVIDF